MRFGVKIAILGLVSAAIVAAAPARASDNQQPAKHKITQAKSYVGLNPMYATVLDNGRPVGTLLVSIGLDIPNATLRANAERALPLLRDSYVRNLMVYAAAAVRPWRQPDVDVIARRLQGVTNRTLHSKGAKVLLGQILLRITK
jgi:hypothetical protein